jgi:hypothetical protein
MPQVTCPNCGTTINLENRKEIDFDMIKSAVRKEPCTFTGLLHATRLSRKTLTVRLKALCGDGILSKEDGKYRMNGTFEYANGGGLMPRGLLKFGHDRRVKTGVLLIGVLLLFSTSGYVLAKYFMLQRQAPLEPMVLGEFTMALDIHDVEDLYGWQVVVEFNSTEMKVLEASPGGFLGTDYPCFLNSTNSVKGELLLTGFLIGQVAGKSGSGRLATVAFGYFANNYKEPTIDFGKDGVFQTELFNPDASLKPITSSMLTLSTIQK